MRHVLIIEPHEELASALRDVVSSARCLPIVRRHLALLSDIDVTPHTIVLRIGHADVSQLPLDRPPIIAIASSDADVVEAERLNCEIVLRSGEIRRLSEVLRTLSVA